MDGWDHSGLMNCTSPTGSLAAGALVSGAVVCTAARASRTRGRAPLLLQTVAGRAALQRIENDILADREGIQKQKRSWEHTGLPLGF